MRFTLLVMDTFNTIRVYVFISISISTHVNPIRQL